MVGTIETKQERSALTEKLLANARTKSLAEVAELTGLSVEDVAERYARLYEDRGWMTERQEERHFIIELSDLINDVRSMLDKADVKDYAPIARVLLGGMQLIAGRMDNRKRLLDEDISRITAAQSHLMASAISLAFDKAVFELQKMYPDVDPEVVNAIFIQSLPLAVNELEANTV